ncbi:MAG TPA: hypothetical protein VN150_10360 [Ochrobactrum sp.]|nr:hypothetical protein [Ochrobactrum sp.]
MLKKIAACLIMAGFFAGCTTAGPSKEVAADPKPIGVDQKVVQTIKTSMKDPFSVREVKVGMPFRAVNNFAHPHAWAVCTTLYAKNSYGAYNQGTYLVFFKNNQVIDMLGGTQTPVYAECGNMHSVAYSYR